MSTTEVAHRHSAICTNSALNLFSTLPTDACFQNVEYFKTWPQQSITQDSPITFVISNLTANHYINLSDAYFTFRVKLLRSDGTIPYTEATKTYDNVSVSNNIASSYINNVSVWCGETQVSNFDNFFLRNSIDNLLHCPKTEQKSVVADSQLLYLKRTSAGTDDESFAERQAITKKGEIFEFIVPFNTDLGSSKKFIISGIDLKFTINLNSPNFYLLGAADQK